MGNHMGWLRAAVAIAAATAAIPAAAQFAKPEDAIKYRQSVMTVMGSHLGRIAAVVKGERPYVPGDVQVDASLIETLSKLPFDAYGPGTDKGAKTRALPEIWSNPAKFRSRAEDMQKTATALNAAARTGRLDTVKPAFSDVAKACKACHDDFRQE